MTTRQHTPWAASAINDDDEAWHEKVMRILNTPFLTLALLAGVIYLGWYSQPEAHRYSPADTKQMNQFIDKVTNPTKPMSHAAAVGIVTVFDADAGARPVIIYRR